jgi:hypothetical protein
MYKMASRSILVTPENAHNLIEEFCEKNDIDLSTIEDYPNIIIMMIKDGYDLCISPSHGKTIMAELLVHHNNQYHYDSASGFISNRLMMLGDTDYDDDDCID